MNNIEFAQDNEFLEKMITKLLGDLYDFFLMFGQPRCLNFGDGGMFEAYGNRNVKPTKEIVVVPEYLANKEGYQNNLYSLIATIIYDMNILPLHKYGIVFEGLVDDTLLTRKDIVIKFDWCRILYNTYFMWN